MDNRLRHLSSKGKRSLHKKITRTYNDRNFFKHTSLILLIWMKKKEGEEEKQRAVVICDDYVGFTAR